LNCLALKVGLQICCLGGFTRSKNLPELCAHLVTARPIEKVIWRRRTFLWQDYQRASHRPCVRAVALCASRKPTSRAHSLPNAFALSAIVAGWVCCRVLARAGDFSHGRCCRGVRYSGTIINAHHVSPPLPSRRALGIK
jgi:hypothetical protein